MIVVGGVGTGVGVDGCERSRVLAFVIAGSEVVVLGAVGIGVVGRGRLGVALGGTGLAASARLVVSQSALVRLRAGDSATPFASVGAYVQYGSAIREETVPGDGETLHSILGN